MKKSKILFATVSGVLLAYFIINIAITRNLGNQVDQETLKYTKRIHKKFNTPIRTLVLKNNWTTDLFLGNDEEIIKNILGLGDSTGEFQNPGIQILMRYKNIEDKVFNNINVSGDSLIFSGTKDLHIVNTFLYLPELENIVLRDFAYAYLHDVGAKEIKTNSKQKGFIGEAHLLDRTLMFAGGLIGVEKIALDSLETLNNIINTAISNSGLFELTKGDKLDVNVHANDNSRVRLGNLHKTGLSIKLENSALLELRGQKDIECLKSVSMTGNSKLKNTYNKTHFNKHTNYHKLDSILVCKEKSLARISGYFAKSSDRSVFANE